MRPVYGTMILLFLQVTFHGISAAGYGGSNDWSFCKGSCSLGQGDCDRDADCSGNLVCGHDNCKQFNSQAHSQADCCIKQGECGSHLLGFVKGRQYPYKGNIFQMAGMYCDNTHEVKNDGTYWLSPNGYNGTGFIAVLDSSGPWKGIKLRNTHNGQHKDRSTKEFSLYFGPGPSGPWKSVLNQQPLVDSRKQRTPKLQTINFQSGNETSRYVKFDVDDFYGRGAGLQYFNMILA